MRNFLLYTVFLCFVFCSHAQKKKVFAKKINSKVNIDGKLNELIWGDIIPAKNFQMIEPINGKIERTNQKTEVKFAAAGDAGISTV